MAKTQKFRDAAALMPLRPEGNDWLQAFRQEALARFQGLGFPTRKLEAWKYINLEPILETPFLPLQSSPCKPHVEESAVASAFLDEALARWTTVNGRCSEKLSACAELPPGTVISDLQSALAAEPVLTRSILESTSPEEKNPFVLLNAAHLEEGIFISIPDDAVFTKPLQLLLIHAEADASPTVSHPRIIMNIGARAKVDLLLTQIGLSEVRSFDNAVLSISVGEAAAVNLVAHARLPEHAIHFFTTRLCQEKGSTVALTSYHHGSSIFREETHAFLTGEEASLKLAGLGLLAHESQLSSHLVVHHSAPRTMSRQLFKNILGGSARSEFNSLSFIHGGSVQADSEQLNRNMVLSKKARAIARPQLKVFHDDVKGAHGATIGQVSPEELFYLRSRGFTAAEARAMLIYGFAEEIALTIPVPSLRRYVERSVRNDLGKVVSDV